MNIGALQRRTEEPTNDVLGVKDIRGVTRNLIEDFNLPRTGVKMFRDERQRHVRRALHLHAAACIDLDRDGYAATI
jgi:hypothetical protein